MSWLLPVAGAGLIWYMLRPSVAASTPISGLDGTGASKSEIARLIKYECQRQGVPEGFAMATAEVESNFSNIKAVNGHSYGPLQVHVSSLEPCETVSDLQKVSFSIKRGVKILKQRLTLAQGDSMLARTMYFCGPGYKTSCSDASIARLRARWLPVANKYNVKPQYQKVGSAWV